MSEFNRIDDKKMNDQHPSFELYNRAINELPPLKRKTDNNRRSRLLPMFATFMAGAIVVSSMSFAADYFNLFPQNNNTASSLDQVRNQQGQIVSASYESGSQTVAATYEQASKAVVKIENYSEVSTNSIYNNPRLWMFFSEEERSNPQDFSQDSSSEETSQIPDTSKMQLSGSGTGYLFEADGYIITNEHVIHGGQYIAVTVPGYDEPFTATVVNSNAELDIAVLKIEPINTESFATIPLGDSDKLKVGEWVIAIGNPYGYDYTMTMGVISAKERPITLENSEGELQTYEHMLQTDASINPGNSGGPLLNEVGEIIGMNTAVNAEAQGIGFAIPINVVKDYLHTITQL